MEGDDCVTACVKAKTGMGQPCSSCWRAPAPSCFLCRPAPPRVAQPRAPALPEPALALTAAPVSRRPRRARRGDYYSCAEDNCFTKCAFSPSSKACHDCSKKYCLVRPRPRHHIASRRERSPRPSLLWAAEAWAPGERGRARRRRDERDRAVVPSQGGAKKCVGIPEMFWPPDIDAVSPKMPAEKRVSSTAAGGEEAVGEDTLRRGGAEPKLSGSDGRDEEGRGDRSAAGRRREPAA